MAVIAVDFDKEKGEWEKNIMISWNETKDITTIATACVASYVAIFGLSAWKKQMKGKTDYDLARRYLRAAFRLRDAIRYVRNPFISHGEILDAVAEARKAGHNIEEGSKNRALEDRAVYSMRWNKVIEAESELQAELVEAEVSWGKNAVIIQQDLKRCLKSLHIALLHYLQGSSGEVDRNIIYEGGNNDELNKNIASALERIENYLKPYLR